MESVQEEAFITVIGIKTRSLIMYRAISSRVKDFKIQQVFETLAKEVAGHLKSFFDLLHIHEEELASILVRSATQIDPYYPSLFKSIDDGITGKMALRLALMEERKGIRRYSSVAESIRENHVREVFFRILLETENHIRMITEEFLHLLEMDKRKDTKETRHVILL